MIAPRSPVTQRFIGRILEDLLLSCKGRRLSSDVFSSAAAADILNRPGL
jgi:hypothetical protein